MAEASMISRRCWLLELPAEVRIEIYRLLFGKPQLFLEGESRLFHCGSELCSCEFPWQIMGTCRDLQNEALPFLLSATTLHIVTTLENADRLPRSYFSQIPRVVICKAASIPQTPHCLDLFAGLKVLEVRNMIVCTHHIRGFWERPLTEEVMVQRALSELKRLNSLLYEFCVDVPRPFRVLLYCQITAPARRPSIVRTESASFFSNGD